MNKLLRTAVIAAPYQLKLTPQLVSDMFNKPTNPALVAVAAKAINYPGGVQELENTLLGSFTDQVCSVKIDKSVDPLRAKAPNMLMKNETFINYVTKEVVQSYPEFIRSLSGVAHHAQLKELSDEALLPTADFSRGAGPVNALNIDRVLASMDFVRFTYMLSDDYVEHLNNLHEELTDDILDEMTEVFTSKVTAAGLAGKRYDVNNRILLRASLRDTLKKYEDLDEIR